MSFGQKDMFDKNDPLIGAVSEIMKENKALAEKEEALKKELGIQSRKELPWDAQADYDTVLNEEQLEEENDLDEASKEKLIKYLQKSDGHDGDHYAAASDSYERSRKSFRKSRNTKLAKSTRAKHEKQGGHAEDEGENQSRMGNNRYLGKEMAYKKLLATKTGKYKGGKNPKVLAKEENLEEGGPTKKHFQQVADLIKAHPDASKRQELADHHASVFAQQNPRFDHKRFHAAVGTTHNQVDEDIFDSARAILTRKAGKTTSRDKTGKTVTTHTPSGGLNSTWTKKKSKR
jgi:hypothetical protein